MVRRSEGYATSATLERKAGRWLRDVRSAVAPRPRLALDPRRCALLVVDMLRYFADPAGRCFLPAAAAIVPNVSSLIAAWRRIGAPVLYTRHCHAGPHDLGMLGRFFSDYIRQGEPDSEIVAALAPARGEPVVRKTTYDAFLGTRLESLLRRRKAAQILICGVLTHMCCETTARAAFCRGFEVYVPVDAVASSDEEHHLASLLNMADAVAIVTSVEEVRARCGVNGS